MSENNKFIRIGADTLIRTSSGECYYTPQEMFEKFHLVTVMGDGELNFGMKCVTVGDDMFVSETEIKNSLEAIKAEKWRGVTFKNKQKIDYKVETIIITSQVESKELMRKINEKGNQMRIFIPSAFCVNNQELSIGKHKGKYRLTLDMYPCVFTCDQAEKICKDLGYPFVFDSHPAFSGDSPEADIVLSSPEESKKGDFCIVCAGVFSKLMKCNRCGKVRYCSRECQKKHWPKHKQECKESDKHQEEID